MSKTKNNNKKKNRRFANPDFRHRSNMPLAPVEEIEQRLMEIVSPAAFAPGRVPDEKKKMRDRILTLPTMVAIVLSLVWRQIPSLSEALRILANEGLLWVTAPTKVSKQALSQRLQTVPASLFAQVFREVICCFSEKEKVCLPGQKKWKNALENFGCTWIADGSTLEALKKKLKAIKGKGCVLGGKMMVIVNAFNHRPVEVLYNQDPKVNDKTFIDQLLDKLPKNGLLVFDLSFFSFPFLDRFTDEDKFFVTRLRAGTSYEVVTTIQKSPRYKDEIIRIGLHRSHPCKHKVRMVSVLWNTTWYRYITNVLDHDMLSAQQVCILYRNRWRIEDAFNLTKRLLCLSYLWVGDSNGVEVQIYATWIFYAVLTDVCQDVAIALGQPLQRISVEMVFRGFYHFSQAHKRGYASSIVDFLTERPKLFGIIKEKRKRHNQNELQQKEIWGNVLS